MYKQKQTMRIVNIQIGSILNDLKMKLFFHRFWTYFGRNNRVKQSLGIYWRICKQIFVHCSNKMTDILHEMVLNKKIFPTIKRHIFLRVFVIYCRNIHFFHFSRIWHHKDVHELIIFMQGRSFWILVYCLTSGVVPTWYITFDIGMRFHF